MSLSKYMRLNYHSLFIVRNGRVERWKFCNLKEPSSNLSWNISVFCFFFFHSNLRHFLIIPPILVYMANEICTRFDVINWELLLLVSFGCKLCIQSTLFAFPFYSMVIFMQFFSFSTGWDIFLPFYTLIMLFVSFSL